MLTMMIIEVDYEDYNGYSSDNYLMIFNYFLTFFSSIVNEGFGSLFRERLGEERVKKGEERVRCLSVCPSFDHFLRK